MRESIDILGEALGLLGGLLSFLGATGIVLFVLSLILMALVGAFSPLPKMLNYVAIVVLVTALAMFGIDGFGELPGRVEALRGYLIVMLSPVVGVFLLKALIGALFRRRSETEQLKDAVTELTEQVAQLRRDRKADRGEARLTIEAKAKEPKLLRRLHRSA
ncbi:hypothetical protein [Parvularcula lutaonensis]|uniref:Uncharacterized protein n=1 Tax=Parvularcula lutaonensis TaxID=491923 RepID=A0ABV7MBZ1_9PROT|nr:hypothetical protein [Parvularcula lutaonensis]GGY47655.1 hypothetical protein GCM10007148_16320 [Parvularcula lutaonensis]